MKSIKGKIYFLSFLSEVLFPFYYSSFHGMMYADRVVVGGGTYIHCIYLVQIILLNIKMYSAMFVFRFINVVGTLEKRKKQNVK